MTSAWTPERRAAAALRIQQWKPWEKSTGPRTPEGKATSSMNRYEGALQQRRRENKRQARQCLAAFDQLELEFRRLVWVEQRSSEGLPTTEWHLRRAQLPDVSILAPHAVSASHVLKLTHFRGHLTVNKEGVRYAQEQAAVPGGIQAADR